MSPEEISPWINMLIYAEPGAGKTYFCGTALDHAETSPVLLLDVEGGTLTLRKKKGIDVVRIRTMAQLEDVHKKLYAQADPYYKTVCIDSLTEMQKLDMHTVMTEQYNKAPDKTDKLVPSPREWGKSNERMRMIIRAFRDLPCHTIMTALRGTTILDSGSTIYFPSLPGKLAAEVPGFFDIVGYLEANSKTENGETVIRRTMQTVKTTKVSAKDRSQSLDALVESPSIPLLWEKIYG